MQVIVHSMSGCPSCAEVKKFLDDVNVPFLVVEHDSPEERAMAYNQLGLVGADRTMPQVVVISHDGNEMLVGGYERTLISGIGGLYRRSVPKVA